MFMGNYHEAIDEYRMDTHNRIAKPMIVTNEWTATTVDASMGSYLDDIIRTIVADDGDARTLPGLCDHDATCLDAALEKKGYAQNDTKAEITMFAPNNITKQLSVSPTMKGKLLPNLLHLGALIAGSGANGPEVSRLLLNINQAWNFLKHFWTSSVNLTTKRLVFLGTALGNGLSGSEVLKLTSIQAKRIDASICNKLRCMMKGKAAWTDPETGLVYRMTSIKVWRYWRLSPYALESCIRRIKWWQVIVTDPTNNAQIIATFFGRHKYNGGGGGAP